MGALGVDLRFKPERDYDSSVKFFGVVSSMIAQALNVQRLVEEERRRLLDENTHLRQELRERYDFSNIIGTSGPTRQMYEQVAQVAQTNTTVLIRGESGTGKELIAHAIHYNSLRAKKPFVKVSCAALPDTLIESELFGYEKGAFTGAAARKKGRFEMAEGGTLFLDEIGDINLGTQVKLLRVLQEREFERVGGTETVKVNVRLIAATNKDMEKAIAEGTFREDLYYRLNVFTIFVPPLRERKADLLLLADHFLEKFSREHGKVIKRISTPAIDMLMRLPLARQRARAGERARARRAGLRRRGHPRPPPAAVAADRRFVGHRDARVAQGRRGGLRAGSDPGRAEDHARQPRQGGAAARHHRAHPQLQGARLRHRRAPLQVSEVGRRAGRRRRRPTRPGISSGNIAAVTRTRRWAAAGCAAVAHRGRALGCGKKGPPLAPFVRVASTPSARVEARRVGQRRLRHAARSPRRTSMRRSRRTSGASTCTRSPRPRRRRAPEALELATLDRDGSGRRRAGPRRRWPASRREPRRSEGRRRSPATTVTVLDALGPTRFVPKALAARRRRHAAARRDATVAVPAGRTGAAAAVLHRRRLQRARAAGPPSMPRGAAADRAARSRQLGPDVVYTADAVTVSWEPSGGLLGFLLESGCRSRRCSRRGRDQPPSGRSDGAAAGPDALQRLSRPGADPLELPPPPARAPRRYPWRCPSRSRWRRSTELTFAEPVEFGRERCYTVRAVRGTGPGAVESAPIERRCVTPVDVFPPGRRRACPRWSGRGPSA